MYLQKTIDEYAQFGFLTNEIFKWRGDESDLKCALNECCALVYCAL